MDSNKPIARMREKLGLTQAELSKLVGVSENTIANWEKGGAEKWIRQLSQLCKIFNCDLEDLAAEKTSQKLTLHELTPGVLDTVKSYCAALLEGDKRAATKIAAFATLHDNSLRYWLEQVDQIMTHRSSSEQKIDCEAISNSLILQNLNLHLSHVLPNEVTLENFSNLVRKVELSYDFLKRYIRFNSERFSRRLVLQTRYLSVYVISWESGQESRGHHHGNSLDAIWVVEGQMLHWLPSPEDSKKELIPFEGCQTEHRLSGEPSTFVAGEWVFIDRRQAHQIAADGKLVTLHIRFGAPPDDDNWDIAQDEPVITWRQTEEYRVMPA